MNSKRLYSFLALGALLPSVALAVPAWPGTVRSVMPDGSVVEVRMHGDENFSFVTDADCSVILERDAEGFLVPAVADGRVLRPVEADIALLRARAGVDNNAPARPMRLPALDELGRSTFPTVGSVKSPVVLLEYADTKFSVPDVVNTFSKLCNGTGYNLYGSRGSVREYFEDSSNGLFSPQFDVYGPVTLPETSQYYTDGNKMALFYEAVEYAMKALDPEVDFSQYDYDGDGRIDNVFFFYAGYGQNQTHDATQVWPHQNDFNKYVPSKTEELWLDGVQMATYACSCELNANLPEGASQPWLDGIGTFVHEFGHVLGLPDLYDTDPVWTATKSPGVWSVMDKGEYNLYSTCPPRYSVYEQWVCGWAGVEEIGTQAATYTLPSISATRQPRALSLRVPKSEGSSDYWNEWYFFETRTAQKWDEGLPEEGLLIWHVSFDADKWAQNKVNTDRKPKWHLMQSGPDQGHTSWPGPDGSHFYLCPDVTTTLTPENSSRGFSVMLDDIHMDNGAAVFGLNRVAERPVSTVSFASPQTDQDSRTLTVSWDPVPGARDYLLTVTLKDEDNWTRYIDYWEQRSTLGQTSVTMANIMEKFWIREVTAIVRVIEDMPSTKTAQIKFTPSLLDSVELPSVSGTVRGLRGAIEAPEGSAVYDLQGRLRPVSGLEPGLYLVRTPEGQTHKITVR